MELGVRLAQTSDSHLTNPGQELTSHLSVRMEHRELGWSSAPVRGTSSLSQLSAHSHAVAVDKSWRQAESFPEGEDRHEGGYQEEVTTWAKGSEEDCLGESILRDTTSPWILSLYPGHP